MNKEPVRFTALSSHPVSPGYQRSSQQERVFHALQIVETLLGASMDNKMLFLLQHDLIEDLTWLFVERLLRYTPAQHILVLVPQKMKDAMGTSWNHAISLSTGLPLAEQFSCSQTVQDDQLAQVSLLSIIDIQKRGGVDRTHPFFHAFDALIVPAVPSRPGPVWCQAIDCFASVGIPVIGLSSMSAEDDGALLFGEVIDTHSALNQKRKRA